MPNPDPVKQWALDRAEARRKATQGTKRPSIVGGILSAAFSKETGMQRYSKLIGGLVGYIAGWIISWLVAKGFGTCLVPSDTTTCTVFGQSAADLSDVVLGLLTLVGVYIAPPNKPPS